MFPDASGFIDVVNRDASADGNFRSYHHPSPVALPTPPTVLNWAWLLLKEFEHACNILVRYAKDAN
ncbi:MAG: hypothetical protein KDB03_11790 [Planctomycetales bacterium]|nr:hypothetical protein [Planctomycetales bacterium]